MGMEFGWWKTTGESGKHQINVSIHGGNIEWMSKQGHHTRWQEYGPPSDEDWERLFCEAHDGRNTARRRTKTGSACFARRKNECRAACFRQGSLPP